MSRDLSHTPINKGDLISGGKCFVREVEWNGRRHRVEMQFYQTRHMGQCWNGLGRDRSGVIYLGVSTHKTNSFVYRFDPRSGQMRYLGDLLSNVRIGGTDGTDNGKIHSSFVEWDDGCMYFLSHYGVKDDVPYGGHLWKYDPTSDKLIDLAIPVAKETNFCLSEIDLARQCSYMFSTPSGVFTRFHYPTGKLTTLGRQEGWYWVRYLPMDRAGCLYTVWDGLVHKYDPDTNEWRTIVRHDHTEDPDINFGCMTGNVWTKDRRRLYFQRYRTGSMFRLELDGPRVECLGRLHPEGKDLYMYNVHLNAAEDRLYCLGATEKTEDKGFYCLDPKTGRRAKFFSLDDILAEELAGNMTAKQAHVDFTDYGGVTGDDGSFYCGFTAGLRDQDANAGGVTVVSLLRFKVTES
jgi:hypothetical protein